MRLYTGDDFNYPELIEGDERRPLRRPARRLRRDRAGRRRRARRRSTPATPTAIERILGPTVPLARHLFAAPTHYYKTGVVFLAWLDGHQDHFAMVGGLHAARSLPHLSTLLRLADQAGALEVPDLAAERWNALLAVHGISAQEAVRA